MSTNDGKVRSLDTPQEQRGRGVDPKSQYVDYLVRMQTAEGDYYLSKPTGSQGIRVATDNYLEAERVTGDLDAERAASTAAPLLHSGNERWKPVPFHQVWRAQQKQQAAIQVAKLRHPTCNPRTARLAAQIEADAYRLLEPVEPSGRPIPHTEAQALDEHRFNESIGIEPRGLTRG